MNSIVCIFYNSRGGDGACGRTGPGPWDGEARLNMQRT